ncbi:hypothetical protein V6N11_061160 [Hibiscus sabdariffa]|uniref:BI1-like protein n=1 Tax=Hibiscus sabdariffa TaxID=183260 RepID=A0ABR2A0J9_9ROSI
MASMAEGNEISICRCGKPLVSKTSWSDNNPERRFLGATTMVMDLPNHAAFLNGKVILEATILTAVVIVSLTLYTFWAAKRGHDFNFLGPFLCGFLLVLIVFCLIQIFFPLGRLSVVIYGGLVSIVFCGSIVYHTDKLINRYSYDQYIWAVVSLYLDVINLFFSLLNLLRAADG